jgi:hypothetical protein
MEGNIERASQAWNAMLSIRRCNRMHTYRMWLGVYYNPEL